MEYLQSLLDSSEIPVVTAFLLGLLTAVSPCPLATNITAIGFISKNLDSRNRIFLNGLLYTAGRMIGLVLMQVRRWDRQLISFFMIRLKYCCCCF